MKTGKASGQVGTRFCQHKFMKTTIDPDYSKSGRQMAYFTNRDSNANDVNQHMKAGGLCITETKKGDEGLYVCVMWQKEAKTAAQ